MSTQLETRTFLWSLLAISIIFILLLKPFFGAIFWACALAIIFFPVQEWLAQKWIKNKNLAALATLIICMTVLITPLFFIFSTVIKQGVNFYHQLQSGQINPSAYVDQILSRYPNLLTDLKNLGINPEQLKATAVNGALAVGNFMAQHALVYGQNIFGLIMSMVLMLYITFFMLRDGKTLIEVLVRALPLGDTRERMLFSLFAEVTRATIKGNVLIAGIQGAIGGITLALLGVPGALVWTVFMCFASLIPAVGSAIIWVPIALYLFAIGQTTQAIILVVVGAGIISTIDSVLRPMLVGRDTKLPDYLVLLSTLGGIAFFGMNGFVIGPLVAAMFLAFWGIFMHEVHIPLVHEKEQAADKKEGSENKIESSDDKIEKPNSRRKKPAV